MWAFVAAEIAGLVAVLGLYSIAEFVLHSYIHPESTDFNSFLISREYLLAFSVGVVEHVIECFFVPWKASFQNPFIFIGILMIVVGLAIRFSAIVTAGRSFHHMVQSHRSDDHVLIRHGIYRYFRHPGYFGFFVFALGTQILLTNLVSTCGFAYVLWHFFAERIEVEEHYLVRFFGDDYLKYRMATRTWIPFIR
jgi:protein-S-isoprenylcysteine O-methyltransferase